VGGIVLRGMPGSVIIAAFHVAGRRCRAQFNSAYREHARRPARAIIRQGNADPEQQEV
jgi:hypothetical protein